MDADVYVEATRHRVALEKTSKAPDAREVARSYKMNFVFVSVPADA
jgi:hypothetical protein